MKLNYKRLGEGPPLIILHGVFGSLDNWFTLGKEFAKSFDVFLVDLRNHGQSPHSSQFNYQVMSEDIVELMEATGLKSVNLIGHSMGGKVAMELAVQRPDLVDKLIVVDIGPKKYPPHHHEIYEAFRCINLDNLTSRNEADQLMGEKIPDFGVRQFILKNLSRNESGAFEWKLNLDALEKNAEKIGEALPPGAPFEKPALFIGGEKSHYILPQDIELIKSHFPKSEIKWVKDSGHWVHAEKPRELYALCTQFLKS